MSVVTQFPSQVRPVTGGVSPQEESPPSDAGVGLHPNLARLAVRYDDAFVKFQAGVMSADEFRHVVGQLCARDDQGVFWALHTDGAWYRQLRDGSWVKDVPPRVGMPSVSPFEVSRHPAGLPPRGDVLDPASRVAPLPPSVVPSAARDFDADGAGWSVRRRVAAAALLVASVVSVAALWPSSSGQAPAVTDAASPVQVLVEW